MEIQYVYQKKRADFGRQCLFNDKGPELIDNFLPDKKAIRDYILRDPVHRGTLCTPVQAEHYLNTTRAEYTNSAMNHVEGGWPKDVNIMDEEQTKRYRRKVEKDENYYTILMPLFKNMENCILQNNALNIYEQYFADLEPTPLVEKSTARTVNVFKDMSTPTRPITHLSWSPDNQTKIVATHCNLKFQANIPEETTHSYIWEIENPNRPLLVLKPEFSAISIEYHQKDPNCLVSGHINGQVGVWDIRKGPEPVEWSLLEQSFRDPVHSVLWINSKSGAEFFSSSTDGQVKWWDIRKMNEPIEVLILDAVRDEEQSIVRATGASCLEYESTIPTRFMVGTEHGTIISGNRKGKTALEKMVFRLQAHYGPVLAIQRNPAYVKNFLSIGDWTAKIWSEDCRESPIMWTNFHKALLTDGCWSPTRISVFFTTRADGVLDVWDILQRQDHACLGVKVCDEPLKCMRTHDMGRLVAVGNRAGAVYLVEFSENLASVNKNDKMLINAMFEREARREKILEARNRELRLKMKTKSGILTEEIKEAAPESVETLFEGPDVKAAEAEFHMVIDMETRVIVPGEDEADQEAMPEELVEETPPPPPPPATPAEPAKGKKGKSKKK